MTNEEFYGDIYFDLQEVQNELLDFCEKIYQAGCNEEDQNPIEHYKVRIKSSESMIHKLEKKNCEVTGESALANTTDVVGARIICSFLSGINQVAEEIRENFEVVEEKDYIRQVKPNGYRSLHLIIRFPAKMRGRQNEVFAEIQLRTIAMDCWASLEHQLKYKHSIQNEELIVEELKRCANELASADLTMQTIHDLLSCEDTLGQEDGII